MSNPAHIECEKLLAADVVAYFMYLTLMSESNEFKEAIKKPRREVIYEYCMSGWDADFWSSRRINELKRLYRAIFISYVAEGETEDVLGAMPEGVNPENAQEFERVLNTLEVRAINGNGEFETYKFFDYIAIRSDRFAVRLGSIFDRIRPIKECPHGILQTKRSTTHVIPAYRFAGRIDLDIPNALSIYSYLERHLYQNSSKNTPARIRPQVLLKYAPTFRSIEPINIDNAMLQKDLIVPLTHFRDIGLLDYQIIWGKNTITQKSAEITIGTLAKTLLEFRWLIPTITISKKRTEPSMV